MNKANFYKNAAIQKRTYKFLSFSKTPGSAGQTKGETQRMGIGYLTVETRTGGQALPVRGARIRIFEADSRTPLFDLETDANGLTEEVALETVGREASLDPDFVGHPYTTYDALAEAEGYEIIHITGIHIFDGIRSRQPVTMIPMLEGETEPSEIDIDLGEIAVEFDTPREQPGPLIEARILRHVIIPDLITVHLGIPTSSAQDIQVTFPDYIANVACSEIYPTWPEASLEANIWVQITFALNRIFTEWYRSQGYAFDITNSTTVDQYFKVGQTIHDNVQQLVSRIFNQYVRRSGRVAPFFTSFCNGTTATCNGLSQWGSEQLARVNGLSALEILRYYYPADVEVTETNIFSGYIESYPGIQRLGSTGADVETIQVQLNRIRQDFPGIPVITDPLGEFGSSTEQAVRVFQGAFGLAVDGIVGKSTWYKLSYIFVAVAKLAGLESEGVEIGVGTVPPNVTLSQGSTGMDVIMLQHLLDFISVYYPVVPTVTLNGIFGADTTASVRAFQQLMGLSQTGIVDAASWDALYDVYWGIINNGTLPPVTGVIEYTVQSGDSLYLLAQRFGTTVDAIKALNGLTGDNIYVGQILLIPSGTEAVTHTVVSGDTLYLLARRYGTTVDEIKALNGLTSDVLNIGQVLLIPGAAGVETPSFTHTVVSGDTLYLLARRYGTTVDEIRALNGLTSDVLNIGQTLLIPGTARTHTVQSGDTLYLLGQRYGTTADAIMALNGLTSSALQIGQVLLIP